MSRARLEARTAPAQPEAEFDAFYWVIGGRWGDDSRSWRRWSEVCGPYLDPAPAARLRQRMLEIHADDPLVHFEVVRSDEHVGA